MYKQKKEFTVVFQPLGKRVVVKEGSSILEAAQKAGVKIWSICGGKGVCGKCKVILKNGKLKTPSNLKLLSQDEIKLGYRLACQTIVQDNIEVTIPPESRLEGEQILSRVNITPEKIEPSGIKVFISIYAKSFINEWDFQEYLKEELRRELGLEDLLFTEKSIKKLRKLLNESFEGLTVTVNDTLPGSSRVVDLELDDKTSKNYGLAVDVGTTAVVVYLVSLVDGLILKTASDYNEQIVYGEDLLSRIEYAYKNTKNLTVLQKAVVNTINNLIERVASMENINPSEITDLCVAGNTVMTYLLLKKDPSNLLEVDAEVSRNPYTLTAKELGFKINPDAGVYVLPCISRFLGGDVVGDILASGMSNSQEISVLVDMGTNGEVVVGNREWLFSASCASGPAFEGWEISHGVRGVTGAIDHVKINPQTYEAEYTVIGGDKSEVYGVCGSGIIDVIAEMFSTGIINSQGEIQTQLNSPLIRVGLKGPEYVIVPAKKTRSGKDIVITQKDINNFLESKAAVCATIITLMKKIGVSIYDVKNLYLAGAFGNYINLQNAVRVGLFPKLPNAKIIQLGNGSIAGSYLALISKQKRKELDKIARLITYFDLGVDNDFMNEYAEALKIPGNPEFFPS